MCQEKKGKIKNLGGGILKKANEMHQQSKSRTKKELEKYVAGMMKLTEQSWMKSKLCHRIIDRSPYTTTTRHEANNDTQNRSKERTKNQQKCSIRLYRAISSSSKQIRSNRFRSSVSTSSRQHSSMNETELLYSEISRE